MLKTASLVLAAALALAALAPHAATAAGAGGTSARAWVSSLGGDAAGCGTVTAPCRTFQYTHDSVVRPGGTIYVKDAGNFVTSVPFTITHAISIINDGVGAATIVAPGADAIDIQAGASDAILLKGLILDGSGSGIYGVNLISAGSLTVANCTAKGFGGTNGSGIFIEPSAGTVSFDIADTLTTGNAFVGIWIAPGYFASGANATVKGALTRIDAIGNQYGVAANNTFNSGNMTLVATQVNSNNNTFGFYSNGASAYLNGSTVTGNYYGLDGQFYSYGNNAIIGNSNDLGAAAVTRAGLQ
jgi:hypothetical protein